MSRALKPTFSYRYLMPAIEKGKLARDLHQVANDITAFNDDGRIIESLTGLVDRIRTILGVAAAPAATPEPAAPAAPPAPDPLVAVVEALTARVSALETAVAALTAAPPAAPATEPAPAA